MKNKNNTLNHKTMLDELRVVNLPLDTNELRVGNWLLDTKGNLAQINEIKRHPSCERNYGYIVTFQELGRFGGYVEDLNPVALTSDILKKCGFELINGYYVNKKKQTHICLLQMIDKYKVDLTGPFGMVSIGSIKHLHQLQNLYLLLTSEELIINL